MTLSRPPGITQRPTLLCLLSTAITTRVWQSQPHDTQDNSSLTTRTPHHKASTPPERVKRSRTFPARPLYRLSSYCLPTMCPCGSHGGPSREVRSPLSGGSGSQTLTDTLINDLYFAVLTKSVHINLCSQSYQITVDLLF